MIYVFLTGKPACGKDTQAKLLGAEIKAKIVTTSKEIDKFFKSYNKKFIKIKGVKINVKKQKELKSKGKLVAYRLVAYIVENILKNAIKNKKSLIFAGSPRSIYEAKTYLNLFKKNKNVKYFFIYLKISDKTVIKRIKERYLREKREDDKPSNVKKRLIAFKKEILPMLQWLKKQKILIEVNGEKTPEEVHKQIINYIK